MRYIEFTLRVDVPTFIQCQINAFQYFGGATESVLYDNINGLPSKEYSKVRNQNGADNLMISHPSAVSNIISVEYGVRRQKERLRTT